MALLERRWDVRQGTFSETHPDLCWFIAILWPVLEAQQGCLGVLLKGRDGLRAVIALAQGIIIQEAPQTLLFFLKRNIHFINIINRSFQITELLEYNPWHLLSQSYIWNLQNIPSVP